ncbi:AbrB/MazE/SpoVT family DNA-binding domain-containing protein [Thermocrinis sp.]
MEEVAKIMARGLIALPSEVRKKLNLNEGDIVKVQVKDDQIILRKEERIFDLKGSIEQTGSTGKSFAQILQEELNKKKKEG